MYKSKSTGAPSDSQAREKLALYVYEYLLHVGAQKAAQTFLNEIRWEKNITLGEPPGFLHSWWCVFWDLYCAAPERRETCDHSSEAKAFHDYGFVNSGYGSNGIPHNSPLRPSPPNQSPGTPGPPMMVGPGGPGFPPKGPWGPNGTRRAHGSWYSYVWTNERTTPWRADAAYIKHGSRGSQTPLASRWSRSDVPVPPQQ